MAFFDVDPDTGEEWVVEPSPSRVLSVLAGGDVEDEDGDDGDAGDAEASARAFLGDEAYDLLVALDARGLAAIPRDIRACQTERDAFEVRCTSCPISPPSSPPPTPTSGASSTRSGRSSA